MTWKPWLTALVAAVFATSAALADDAAKKELAPTGKLRVGIAIAPTVGAGNVARESDGSFRGIAIDLGNELAQKLGVSAEFVPYPNSGALTDAVDAGAWDLAFLPVDAERKKRVDFGSAHIVLQSTYLVGPSSPIKTLADVDKAGVRVMGVENTATARASAASLKMTTIGYVKTADELFELLQLRQCRCHRAFARSLCRRFRKAAGVARARRRLSELLRRARCAEGKGSCAAIRHYVRRLRHRVRQRAPLP